MIRREILDEAIAAVCSDRNLQYGDPEDNFERIAEYWEKYLRDRCVEPGCEVCVTSDDVALMMILFKVARCITAQIPTRDSFIDIAGYAACGGEICGRREKRAEQELLEIRRKLSQAKTETECNE